MRVSGIFVLFAVNQIVQCAFAWWATALRGIEPIILSFGAAFTAHDVQLFDVKGWFINKFDSKVKTIDGNNFDKESFTKEE